MMSKDKMQFNKKMKNDMIEQKEYFEEQARLQVLDNEKFNERMKKESKEQNEYFKVQARLQEIADNQFYKKMGEMTEQQSNDEVMAGIESLDVELSDMDVADDFEEIIEDFDDLVEDNYDFIDDDSECVDCSEKDAKLVKDTEDFIKSLKTISKDELIDIVKTDYISDEVGEDEVVEQLKELSLPKLKSMALMIRMNEIVEID